MILGSLHSCCEGSQRGVYQPTLGDGGSYNTISIRLSAQTNFDTFDQIYFPSVPHEHVLWQAAGKFCENPRRDKGRSFKLQRKKCLRPGDRTQDRLAVRQQS